MKVIVTPECNHDSTWYDHGEPFVGRHVLVSSEGVCLDGVWVIRRDRRMKTNRMQGHPWLTDDEGPWTTFTVDVQP